MSEELKYPIIFGGTKYFFVEQFIFNCTSINIRFGGGGGSFITIPISPLDYRMSPNNVEYFSNYNPKCSQNSYSIKKKACAEISYNETHTIFNVYSDYGDKFTIQIPNFMRKEIQFAIHSAIEKGLINNTRVVLFEKYLLPLFEI